MSLRLALSLGLSLSLPLGAVLGASPRCPSKEVVGAAYMISNDESSNNLIIHSIYQDGRVVFAGLTSAGGVGGRVPAPPGLSDALTSQGSILVSENFLFTVNPGSCTVAMFSINASDPTQLTMIGDPVDSGGDFPTSIDRSPDTGNICVMNSGDTDGIQCFSVDPDQGLAPIPNTNRAFNGPSLLPSGKLSQILFNQDGSYLMVQDKGSANVSGHISTFRVHSDGSLSKKPVETYPPKSRSPPFVPFGIIPIYNTDNAYLFGQPIGGYGIVVFDKGYNAPGRISSYTIDGQNTTCWLAYSEMTDSYYLSDTQQSRLYELQLDDDLNPTLIETYYDSTMPIDLTAAGIMNQDYLYVNGAGSLTLDVYQLLGPGDAKLIQRSGYQTYVAATGEMVQDDHVQGMAVWLKN